MLKSGERVAILLFLGIVLFSGCQTIKYKAEPSPLITMKKTQEQENFAYDTDIVFYWWGFYPSMQTVNLTQIAQENGAEHGLTDLRIRESAPGWKGTLLTLVTLGIYAPRNVQIYGVKVFSNRYPRN